LRYWGPIALGGAGVLLIGYALFFRRGDDEKIRRKITDLAEAVRMTEGETNVVVRGGRIQSAFSEIFAKDVRVVIPDLGPLGSTRKELAGVAAQTGLRFQSAEVSFDGVSVAIEPSKTAASASANGTFTGFEHGSGIRRETRKVEFRFDKIDGDWRIVSLDVAPRTE
jgi:hypothetical protein